jgi:hypothetical protein
MTIYNTYSVEGNFETEEEAISWACGFVFSECEKTEQEISHSRFVEGLTNGIKIYYCYGADHYFFCDRLEETNLEFTETKTEDKEIMKTEKLVLPMGAKLIMEDGSFVLGELPRDDKNRFVTWAIDFDRKSFSTGHYDLSFYSGVCDLKSRAEYLQDELVIAPKTKIHFFESTSEAYNACIAGEVPQWETFIVEDEDVIGIASSAWPIAFTEENGEIHKARDNSDNGLVKCLKGLFEEKA